MQVNDGLPSPPGQKRSESDILQQGNEHHQKLLARDSEFQMILCFGIREGAAGKEYAAYKGSCPLITAQQLKGDALRVQHGKVIVQVDAVRHIVDSHTVGKLTGGKLFLPQGNSAAHRLDALHQLGIVLRGAALPGQHLHFGNRKFTGKNHQSKGLLVGKVLANRTVG